MDNSKTRLKGQSKVSDGMNESDYQGKVMSAIKGFCAGRRGKGHARRRSRSLQGTETARHKSNGTHRHSGGLQGTQAGEQREAQRHTGRNKEGQASKISITPQSLPASYSRNTNTCKLPAGVNL